MKRYLLTVIAVSAILFSIGCDISRYPIDAQPQVKVDPRLEGKWRPVGKDSTSLYIVKRKNEYQYSLMIKSKDFSKMKLNAFLSEVDNARFLNIFDHKDSGYLFLRILDLAPSASKVTVTMVNDSTMKDLNGPAEVRKRISNNLSNPSFYTDTVTMRKEK